jgi:hypothetical protein
MRIVSWLLQVKCRGLELNEEVERMRRSIENYSLALRRLIAALSQFCVRSDFDLNSENTKYPLSEIAAR